MQEQWSLPTDPAIYKWGQRNQTFPAGETMAGEGWASTKLWKLVKERVDSDHPVHRTIVACMPKIEALLRKASTAPNNFTLHDDEHGFRVAQRMDDLVPSDVMGRMSPLEIALLILSAYLHDIGMNPAQELVDRHHRYLISAEARLLTSDEIEALQSWLDVEHDALEPPVCSSKPTSSELELAQELTAYYCRERHNDWSEEWIRANLTSAEPGLYSGWIDDLVLVCRSHHEGLSELRARKFDVRIVNAQPLNLRYLAAVLRTADVLEFDPERTPEIILKHRGIAKKSWLYWRKDHFIHAQIDRTSYKMILTARTKDARTHKAVLETADAVDQELLACAALQNEGAYNSGIILEKDRYYEWPWSSKLTRDIEEASDSFVFIDGSFRPDSQRLLRLFGGRELYGTPLAAVRELLQNAFDAVREQVACERLQKSDPSDEQWVDRLGAVHQVSLELMEIDGDCRLICTDDGVGMTRGIIQAALLVSGARPPQTLHALERNCQKYGFSTGRTGQFGIGALSYFMLARRIVIETRRSDQAGGDPDNTGWVFQTDGINEFGELRRTRNLRSGTKVTLYLRPEVVGTLSAFRTNLLDYLGVVRWVPCKFEVSAGGIKHISAGPGWVFNQLELAQRMLIKSINAGRGIIREAAEPFRTKESMRQTEETKKLWSEAHAAAQACIEISSPIEGDLPKSTGRFRVFLPYFRIGASELLAFVSVAHDQITLLPDGGVGLRPGATVHHSWKGFSTGVLVGKQGLRDTVINVPSGFHVEIDWRGGGQISLHRQSLTLSDKSWEASKVIRQACERAMTDFFAHSDGFYSSINYAVARSDYSPPFPSELSWGFADASRERYSWRPIKFPAVELERDNYESRESVATSLSWNGNSVEAVDPLKISGNDSRVSPLSWRPADRIVLTKRKRFERLHLLGLWEQAPRSDAAPASTMQSTLFPHEWNKLCAIDNSRRRFRNREHPLVRKVTPRAWSWVLAGC
jgi:hypothetical protein